MKTCECGGIWYRHGKFESKRFGPGVRYRCKDCGKCITVRDGEIAKHTLIKDWRHEVGTGGDARKDLRGVPDGEVRHPNRVLVRGSSWLEPIGSVEVAP